jgi:dipeptidyl aminopeptidase/acylaminoacyl peptidase
MVCPAAPNALRVLPALLLLVALAPPAPAQQISARIEEVLADTHRGQTISQVALSPDGRRIAWIVESRLRVALRDDPAHSREITVASKPDEPCSQSQLAWAPNSSALAFLAECKASGSAQSVIGASLYLVRFGADLNLQAPTQVFAPRGYIESPAFSPDGKAIAFLYVEGATRPAGALAATKLPSGAIGEEGLEVQRVAEVAIPEGWNGEPAATLGDSKTTEDRPLASRASNRIQPPFRFLTPANLHVFEFDWSPDSASIAFIAADPPGENNWWVAKLYTERLAADDPPVSPNSLGAPGPDSGTRESTDAAPTAILSPSEVSGSLHGLQIALPRWSPDGKTIAFIGGLMSDQGVTGGDLWVVPAGGGAPRNLTANRPSTAYWLTWQSSQSLYLTELAGGEVRLVRLSLRGDSASEDPPVFSFAGSVGDGRDELGLSASAGRSAFVFTASDFAHPPEIYEARPGAADPPNGSPFPGLARLTRINEGTEPAWGKSVSLTWTDESFHVQGWLILPKAYDPSRKYPMMVQVHGGPAWAFLSRWQGGVGGISATAFSALGYFVFLPNPRGSFGQGETFTEANRKDFGYGDLRDILAGVDTVLKGYSVDPNRVGIAGWSYGGFMAMFAITQTHRFRAAVAGAGISDWLSYYGENSIDQWMIPYFGASVYDDPAVYAKSSAIDSIKQATTPTLVVVGDRDGECPAPQSYEFWHALRGLHVPTRLVVYPNEGHGFTDPAHTRDVLERSLEWFDRYMPPGQ